MELNSYLSGGASNADPAFSLGGDISSNRLFRNAVTISTANIAGLTGVDAAGLSKPYSIRHQSGSLLLVDSDNNQGLETPVSASGPYLLKPPFGGGDDSGWLLLDVDVTGWPAADADDAFTLSPIERNLFDDISAQQARDGLEDYRCFYLKNDSIADTYTVKLFMTETAAPDQWSVAVDPAGVNGAAEVIADEATPPAGPVFSLPDYFSPLDFTLAPSQFQAVWIKRQMTTLNFFEGLVSPAIEILVVY
ncbi:MAG: hypothetical protein V7731_01835 [Amphritea sp.]